MGKNVTKAQIRGSSRNRMPLFTNNFYDNVVWMLEFVHVNKEGFMIKVSATKLRNKFFEYLDKVTQGETIVIQRNNQDIARLVSLPKADWRVKMKVQPKILVSPEDLIKPLEDI